MQNPTHIFPSIDHLQSVIYQFQAVEAHLS